MTAVPGRLALAAILVAANGALPAQESGDETSRAADAEVVIDEPGPSVENCFNSDGIIDISVLDDAHMYVRTRGSNFYLITTELCEGLERSYLRRTARLVPFGRTVCATDGSHIIYEAAGRELICPLRRIERVDDRDQARDLAAGEGPTVILEEIPAEPAADE